MCIVPFCIVNNYRGPHSRFTMRSTHTDAPPRQPALNVANVFTASLLRATQHATGSIVKVALFSHRETCSHHKGSFAGHTQKYCCNRAGRKYNHQSVYIQALYPADGMLPVISSKHQLLFVNLALVPGRQLANPQLQQYST